MEVRLWDVDLLVADKYDDMKLIKSVEANTFEFGGSIVIDGKSYHQVMYSREKDLLCVKPVTLNEEGEENESISSVHGSSISWETW